MDSGTFCTPNMCCPVELCPIPIFVGSRQRDTYLVQQIFWPSPHISSQLVGEPLCLPLRQPTTVYISPWYLLRKLVFHRWQCPLHIPIPIYKARSLYESTMCLIHAVPTWLWHPEFHRHPRKWPPPILLSMKMKMCSVFVFNAICLNWPDSQRDHSRMLEWMKIWVFPHYQGEEKRQNTRMALLKLIIMHYRLSWELKTFTKMLFSTSHFQHYALNKQKSSKPAFLEF